MTWDNAIENYKTFLILEKSLSANSVEAYLNDIRKLAKYCEEKHNVKQPHVLIVPLPGLSIYKPSQKTKSLLGFLGEHM